MTECLSERQIAILIAIASLEEEATIKELERLTTLPVQSLRNVLSELNKLGLITSIKGLGAYGFLSTSLQRKEVLYTLKMDFEQIIKEHQEILEWSKKALHVDSMDSLKEELKKIKSIFKDKEQVELTRNIIDILKAEGEEISIGLRTKKGLTFAGVPKDELIKFLDEIKKRKKLKLEKDNE
jgi:predicted transcriptional regulator